MKLEINEYYHQLKKQVEYYDKQKDSKYAEKFLKDHYRTMYIAYSSLLADIQYHILDQYVDSDLHQIDSDEILDDLGAKDKDIKRVIKKIRRDNESL